MAFRRLGSGILVPYWVWTGLGVPAAQLDFARRRYWWGGAYHHQGEFLAQGTGMIFDSHGMWPGASGYLRQTLAALGMTGADTAGTIVSGLYVLTAAPGVTKWIWAVSDGTNQEYHALHHQTAPQLNQVTVDGGVSQNTGLTQAVSDGTKYAAGFSWTLNNNDAAFNTDAAVNDNNCTMPTVAAAGHLTVGAAWNAAANWEFGAVGHLLLYNEKKSAADLRTAATFVYGLQT